MGYRTLGASEASGVFRGLFGAEPAASHRLRFEQDDRFFHFTTSAAAAAENLVFASYIAARGLAGGPLTEEELFKNIDKMLKVIRSTPATADLGKFLTERLDEADAEALFEMRDVLLHRGRLGRNHFVGGQFHQKMTLAQNPKGLPLQWNNTFVFDAQSADPWERWLAAVIEGGTRHTLNVLRQAPSLP